MTLKDSQQLKAGTTCRDFENESNAESVFSTDNPPLTTSGSKLETTLAKVETNAVRFVRLVVFSVLVAAAILVSVGVYFYMKNEEAVTFEEQFYDLSSRLVEGFHANARLRLQVMDMFATSITSTALATDQVWPFVVIPDYDAKGTAARSILGAWYLGVYPIVTKELRRPWEEYTQGIKNLAWINESLAFQEDFYSTHNRSSISSRRLQNNVVAAMVEEEPYDNSIGFEGVLGTIPQIHRYADPENPNDAANSTYVHRDEDAPGPFYVVWQVSPTTPEQIRSINFDVADPMLGETYTQAVTTAHATSKAVFGGVWNVRDDGTIPEDDDYSTMDVPLSSLIYPIFDKITGQDKQAVALIELSLEFGPFFTSVLPPQSPPMLCVVSNCKQVFSFEVTGEKAMYLGAEDLHDSNYNEVSMTTMITDFELSKEGTLYNGVPVFTDACTWKLNIYATKDMEDAFVTSNPLYYMSAVLGVFIFTCLTFVLYDCLVERRQKIVMTTAVTSDRIVASLFPKTFREALYKESALSSEGKQNNQLGNPFRIGEHRSQTFSSESSELGKPMARLYPDCTVFFADIAGFTAWSSARNPVQVFTLLETLYGAFDKLAERNKVFKIETVGDCYVAVTGLPDPQPNHALLMVKFARDVLGKMSQLTRILEVTLGPDTMDLALRVGLHSGPVTAGVLRGQKARFQLFGDTVNTAARMESNGLKNSIHSSQETANLLAALGKEQWVYPREEKITAKVSPSLGLGELQTYWIRPNSTLSITSRPSALEENNYFAFKVEEAIAGLAGGSEEKHKWTDKNFRRIDWAVDLLLQELEKAFVVRQLTSPAIEVNSDNRIPMEDMTVFWNDPLLESLLMMDSDETSRQPSAEVSPRQDADETVRDQLKAFISQLAYRCRTAEFHNWNHACQVLMSANKMMAHVEGVTSRADHRRVNPLAKFALLLASIVRDVAPTTVVDDLASKPVDDVVIKNAFLESLVIAWNLLMADEFVLVRAYIGSNLVELQHFKQLLVNFVFAADLSRWRRDGQLCCHAFGYQSSFSINNLQMAAVLEQISLASQWTHMMQHGTTYKTWNDCLIQELRRDFEDGKILLDPLSQWFPCERVLFDEIIIPLLNRLAMPCVLGATGDQMLKYAIKNRGKQAEHLPPEVQWSPVIVQAPGESLD